MAYLDLTSNLCEMMEIIKFYDVHHVIISDITMHIYITSGIN